MADVLAMVRKTLADHSLLAPGEPVVVGVSGGLDSTVLLHVLHRLAPDAGWKLVVAHFNHRLRGRSSDADERFVVRLAAAMGLRCERGEVESGVLRRTDGQSLEMAARWARHGFLARTARALGASVVALGHHADDQVETFFLRLGRGAAGDGLAGMRWSGLSPVHPSVRLIRPLLGVRRVDLAAYARREGISHREDASNRALVIRRNWVRRRLLPQLRRHLQPGFEATLARTMELVGAEAEYVEQAARAWLEGKGRRVGFEDLAVALQRRVLLRQMRGLGIEGRFDWIEGLRRSAWAVVTVAPGRLLRRDARGLVEEVGMNEAAWSTGQASRIIDLTEAGEGSCEFGGCRFEWKVRTAGRVVDWGKRTRGTTSKGGGGGSGRGKELEGGGAEGGVEVFDAERVGLRVELRHWQPGDRFRPIGMAGRAKLQDLFTNARVARRDRYRRVMAVGDGGEIFWVEGFRIGEVAKVSGATGRWLEWRWERTERPGAPGVARVAGGPAGC